MGKGTKIDLTALGPNRDDIMASLPSAPDANRDPNARFDPRAQRQERTGFQGENDPWRGGGGGGGPRGGGGYGDRENNFSNRGGGFADRPMGTRGAGFAASRGLGGGATGGYAASNEDFPEVGMGGAPSSRPPQSLASKAAASGGSGTQQASADKWGSVFGKSGRGGLSSDSAPAPRQAAMMPDSYGGSDRGGGRRGNDADSDPRFAGKFGKPAPSLGPGGDRFGSGRGNMPDRDGFTTVGAAPLPTLGPTKDEVAAEKERKENEKKARKAARDAQLQQEKEEKAAAKAAKDAAIQAEKDAVAAAFNIAKDVYNTGLKGEALAEHISGLSAKPTCGALLTQVLKSLSDDDVNNLKWSTPSEYGSALGSLVKTAKDQLTAIYACQEYCHDKNFPKIGPKKSSLISLMFQVLYKYEIAIENGFSAWQDDDESEVPGRMNATVQTTAFMQLIFEPEEEDENSEEEEDEEIDAPRETC